MVEIFTPELKRVKEHPAILTMLAILLSLILAVYLMQRVDWPSLLCQCRFSPAVHFAVNKTVRLLLNDVLMLCFIHLWFRNDSITRAAIFIQLIDTFLMLPLYLALKLSVEGPSEISSPLLSQFHRLIVNPTLMLLIFPAVYFQRYKSLIKGTAPGDFTGDSKTNTNE